MHMITRMISEREGTISLHKVVHIPTLGIFNVDFCIGASFLKLHWQTMELGGLFLQVLLDVKNYAQMLPLFSQLDNKGSWGRLAHVWMWTLLLFKPWCISPFTFCRTLFNRTICNDPKQSIHVPLNWGKIGFKKRSNFVLRCNFWSLDVLSDFLLGSLVKIPLLLFLLVRD